MPQPLRNASLNARRSFYMALAEQYPELKPWHDIGEGACVWCGDQRRLYQLDVQDEVRVCAPCTQTLANCTMSNRDRTEEAVA